jgi:hypothetical protein
VRWPGRKAGVRWNVREEHLSALTFFGPFFCQEKKGQRNETDRTAEVSRQPEKEASFARKPDFLLDLDFFTT